MKLKCRFGCDEPVGIYHVPKGCICWNDPIQALCAQHVITAESEGPIELIQDLSNGEFDLKERWKRNDSE